MPAPERPAILVIVDPPMLGELLTEILRSIGEDEVTTFSPVPPVSQGQFSVAIVSSPLPNEAVAEWIIQLPGPGQEQGELRGRVDAAALAIRDTIDILETLDRLCPMGRARAELLAR